MRSRLMLLLVAGGFAACEAGSGEAGRDGERPPADTTRAPLTWSPSTTIELDSLDGATLFGTTLALDGDTLVIGGLGHVLVYRGAASEWHREARLNAPYGDLGFGGGLAIEGDRLLVGTQLYRRIGQTWTHEQTLATQGAVLQPRSPHEVSLSGERLAVAAHSTDAYGQAIVGPAVFERAGDRWLTRGVFLANPRSSEYGTEYAVALSSRWLLSSDGARIVVRSGDVDAGVDVELYGDAHPFNPANTRGTFGDGLVLDGDRIATGSVAEDAVYVFEYGGGAWSRRAKFEEHLDAGVIPPPGSVALWFGQSVALRGDTLLIGVPGADDGHGKLVRYRRTTGAGWGLVETVHLDPDVDSDFGEAVAIAPDGRTMAASSTRVTGHDGGTAILSGAVHVFTSRDMLGEACTTGAGCESGSCAQGVCCETACDRGCETCNAAGRCVVAPARTVCRPAAGPCDAEERCDGLATTCGADRPHEDGWACNDSDGACIAGVCVPPASAARAPAPNAAVPSGTDGGCAVGPVRASRTSVFCIVLGATLLLRRRRR